MRAGSEATGRLEIAISKPHYRRCWDCGAISLHADNVTPEVLCKRCGSQDTRMIRNLPPLWGTGPGIYIPKGIAKCPECQGELVADCTVNDPKTGRPIATGIELDCVASMHEARLSHSFAQSKWQPVRDAVAKWCDARVDFVGR
jgi:DNA-directed RNA polymerase subunit RPC12/RpoP